MAVLMAIFLADSMLFSLEFRLASVSFFFPASYLDGVGVVIEGGGGGGADGAETAVATCEGGGVGAKELMKEFNFFSSSALSLLSWNLGTGGGRLGLSIMRYIYCI
jgi:hypothetical protein